MNPTIKFYPPPRRSNRSALMILAIYTISGLISFGLIAIAYNILR